MEAQYPTEDPVPHTEEDSYEEQEEQYHEVDEYHHHQEHQEHQEEQEQEEEEAPYQVEEEEQHEQHADYPVEEAANVDRSASLGAAEGPHPMQQLIESQEKLKARRAEHQQKIDAFLQENNLSSLPTEEELQSQRAQLLAQVRHHKDEGDSLCLQIEDQQIASAPVYEAAARVERYEKFVTKAEEYVQSDLSNEIEEVIQGDKHHSDEEIAQYIKELQQQRDETLQRMKTIEERTSKRTQQFRSGKYRDPPSKARSFNEEHTHNGIPERGTSPRDANLTLDEETEMALQYNSEAQETKAELSSRLKRLKQLRSKLQVQINTIKHNADREEKNLQSRIRQAELANVRDQSICQQLNSSNAALTTSSQMIMNQLNVEYYGMDGAPVTRKKIADRSSATRQNQRAIEDKKVDGKKSKTQPKSQWTNAGCSLVGSEQSSRRGSTVAKPPLVARKPTAAQKNRQAAVKADRDHKEEEERSEARFRRGSLGAASDANSIASSRRGSTVAKPPLVARKPTASQKTRNAELQAERERRMSESQPSVRRMSESSTAGKPPLVASKTTAAQKTRNAELQADRERRSSIGGGSEAIPSVRSSRNIQSHRMEPEPSTVLTEVMSQVDIAEETITGVDVHAINEEDEHNHNDEEYAQQHHQDEQEPEKISPNNASLDDEREL